MLTFFSPYFSGGILRLTRKVYVLLRREKGLGIISIRLVIINGHAAVVRNPGELNDAQGAQMDGTASWKLCAQSEAPLTSRSPLRVNEWASERAKLFCVWLAPATSPCIMRRDGEDALSSRTFNDDNLSTARYDLKYRWPSFRGAVNDPVSSFSLSFTFWNGYGDWHMKYEFPIEGAPELRTLCPTRRRDSLFISPLSFFPLNVRIGVNEFGIDATGLLSRKRYSRSSNRTWLVQIKFAHARSNILRVFLPLRL